MPFGHKAGLPPSKKYLLMRQPLFLLAVTKKVGENLSKCGYVLLYLIENVENTSVGMPEKKVRWRNWLVCGIVNIDLQRAYLKVQVKI